MFKADRPLKTPLFDYYAPLSDEFRGLLSIPHSGEVVPAAFNKYLSGNMNDYREDVDFKVNELVDIKAFKKLVLPCLSLIFTAFVWILIALPMWPFYVGSKIQRELRW